ncbi:Protein FAM184A [Tupaia chinensis]|uniref:Protein FAM184A n=1 Tax=Tupaia chinensis TaxID=246437 RepID=L9JI59_TUPCH|nr:Protein FAM184A [Tupaia chinensis]
MATPGMSWQQHYYGGSATGAAKFAPSPAAAQLAGHSMDYSLDMHLKMSKKIAQLTKVKGAAAGRGRRRPRAGISGLTCPPGRQRALPAGRREGGSALGATARDLSPKPPKLWWNAGDVN